MTDEGLKELTYNLEELIELKNIDYDFEKFFLDLKEGVLMIFIRCAKITPKALEDFELNMKSLITRNKD